MSVLCRNNSNLFGCNKGLVSCVLWEGSQFCSYKNFDCSLEDLQFYSCKNYERVQLCPCTLYKLITNFFLVVFVCFFSSSSFMSVLLLPLVCMVFSVVFLTTIIRENVPIKEGEEVALCHLFEKRG